MSEAAEPDARFSEVSPRCKAAADGRGAKAGGASPALEDKEITTAVTPDASPSCKDATNGRGAKAGGASAAPEDEDITTAVTPDVSPSRKDATNGRTGKAGGASPAPEAEDITTAVTPEVSPSCKAAANGQGAEAGGASRAPEAEDITTAVTPEVPLSCKDQDVAAATTPEKRLGAVPVGGDHPAAAQAAEGVADVLREPVPAANPRTPSRAALAEGERPPAVWLVARLQSACLVPLACSLRAAGYRVKALVPGAQEYLFESYSIPCVAVDAPICFRLPQIEKFLRMKVAEMTEDSEVDISKESFEDIFLDLRMQMEEALHWKVTRACREDAKSIQAVFAPIAPIEERFNEICWNSAIDTGAWWNFCKSEFDACTEHSAQDAGLIKVRMQRRRQFLAEIKRRAYEARVTPLDFLECLHATFRQEIQKLLESHLLYGEPTHTELLTRLEDFSSWQRNRSLQRWWEVVLGGLPNQSLDQAHMVLFFCFRRGLISKTNLMHEAADASTEDRPKLAIYHLESLALVRELPEMWGIRTLSLWPDIIPTQAGLVLQMFNIVADCEASAEPPEGPRPFHERGPLVLRERLEKRGPVLACASPLLVQEGCTARRVWCDEGEMERLRQRHSGFFFLGADTQLQATDDRVFGGQRARRELEDFLSTEGRGEEPPVCIAWGRMTDGYGAERTALTFLRALRFAKRRGIVVSKWTHLSPAVLRRPGEEAAWWDENVLFLRAAPCEWLFPRCCCVVTYGGVSTVGAILRSGTPAVVVAESLTAPKSAVLGGFLELGVAHLHPEGWGEVDPEHLGRSISMVAASAKHQAAAKDVRERIAADRGAEGAVEMVAQVLRLRAEDWSDDFLTEPNEPEQPPDQKPASAVEPRLPWADGEYDVYEALSGKRVDGIRIRGDSGEFTTTQGKLMWFEAGDFRPPDKNRSYMVQCYSKVLSFANITSDGLVWDFSDGVKFVYRSGFSKNCECRLL